MKKPPCAMLPCSTCRGAGTVVCVSHQGPRCLICGGSGVVPCPTCGGSGKKSGGGSL